MIDKKNLCPNCGAQLTGLELRCPECGYTLTAETNAGKTTTDSILSLQEKLVAVDKVFSIGTSSKKKASIINAFPLPQTMESLVRLLHMSYSNFEASKESGDKKLAMAWLGKAVESYRRLSEFRKDETVAAALEKYSVLGDKKAFAKLSGSRAKKRIIGFIALAILALAGTFVALFDWTGYYLKKGKVNEVIQYYTQKGKTDKLLNRLIEFNLYEEAAEVMAANGSIVNAVSLLVKEDALLPALLLTAKATSEDSIHFCVDEFEKKNFLSSREEFYLDEDFILSDHRTKLTSVYDHNRASIRYQIHTKDTSVIWEDVWKINNRLVIPEPHLFLDSHFQRFYRGHNHWGRFPKPDYFVNYQNKVVLIRLGEEQDLIYPLDFKFTYDGKGTTLYAETLIYKDIPFYEVLYDYGGAWGTALTSVRQHYILEDCSQASLPPDSLQNEIRQILKEMDLSSWSTTAKYYYENGKLAHVDTSCDYDEKYQRADRLMYKVVFYYYDNLTIEETVSIDKDTQIETIQPDKTIRLYHDGKLIESFPLAIDIPESNLPH